MFAITKGVFSELNEKVDRRTTLGKLWFDSYTVYHKSKYTPHISADI